MLTRAARFKTVATSIAVLGLGVFGAELLALFGTDESYARGAYLPMLLLAASFVVRSAGGASIEVLSVSGKHARAVVVAAASIGATTALQLLVAPAAGLVGASCVLLAVSLVSTLWLRSLCRRELGLDPSILARLRRAPGPRGLSERPGE